MTWLIPGSLGGPPGRHAPVAVNTPARQKPLHPSAPRGASPLLIALPVGVALSVRPSRKKSRRSALVKRFAIVNNDGCELSNSPVKGLEAWRALPEDLPDDLDRIVTDIMNDIVLEELDHSPLRYAPIMHMPVEEVPCIGQLRCLDVKVGSHSHLALQSAQEEGGFIGCCVDVPKAKVLPRGCVGAELQRFGEMPGNRVRAVLRGVNSLRLINRRFAPKALVQEVHEWTDFEEENGGETRVLQEVEDLLGMFKRIAKLQRRTGLYNAGDFVSRSLPELVNDAIEILEGVRFSGIAHASPDSILSGARRRAVVISHMAVSALKGGKLEEYVCDPSSVLRRLLRVNKFMRTFERILSERDSGSGKT